jgi:para-aminobenzoate synthetase/4-amino-4-deoxychorismate lyase
MRIIDFKNSALIRDAKKDCWLLFQNPNFIFSTTSIDEVLPMLQKIEQMVNEKELYAVGFISYEASPAFDPALKVLKNDSFPLIWFGLYKTGEIFTPDSFNKKTVFETPNWLPSLTPSEYKQSIKKIKEHLLDGNTYQVNYTFRLRTNNQIDSDLYLQQLVSSQDALYGAYLSTEDWIVLSHSPELFFQLDGENIFSRPMKGTAPRGLTYQDDLRQSQELFRSQKNRAENVMIVDMVRNDIGHIAKTGTIRVDRLFQIEKYSTVWQMTSTVSAKTEASWTEIIQALFPPASVTGAPKPRTMQIISELEKSPRRVYTGCIGFLAPKRKAQFNVAIRTLLLDRTTQKAEYGVGGGIVWDSNDTLELEEAFVKARIITRQPVEFSLLETMLWVPGEGIFLLEYHLDRLKQSAEYFNYPVNVFEIRQTLTDLVLSFQASEHKIRLLLSKSGKVEYQAEVLKNSCLKNPICFAKSPVDTSDVFLYHKTTHRKVYEKALADCPGYDDVILWNEKEEVTESCIANIVVDIKGKLYTPPVKSGLLAGTYRARMLEKNMVKEKVLTKEDVLNSQHIYLVNSVQKQKEVTLKKPSQVAHRKTIF